MESEPKSHLVGRITSALAEDERSNALGIQITVAGGRVFLMGTVPTEELRRAIETVVAELLDEEHPIVNNLTVAELNEAPGASEHIK